MTTEEYRTLGTVSGRGLVAAYPLLLDIVRNIEREAALALLDRLDEGPATPIQKRIDAMSHDEFEAFGATLDRIAAEKVRRIRAAASDQEEAR